MEIAATGLCAPKSRAGAPGARIDLVLLGAVFALGALGLVMVYS